jgi:8-oxo-dGTP pyrophosphatase MutT (NUDIX family)
MKSRPSELEPIRISAAIITDESGRMLVVRKRDTAHFMQPGGKLEADETPLETLARELTEELGCILVDADFCGIFSADAANEPGQIVEATVYRVRVAGEVKAAAEIAELAWLDPHKPADIRLAPLTRDHAIGLVLSKENEK